MSGAYGPHCPSHPLILNFDIDERTNISKSQLVHFKVNFCETHTLFSKNIYGAQQKLLLFTVSVNADITDITNFSNKLPTYLLHNLCVIQKYNLWVMSAKYWVK